MVLEQYTVGDHQLLSTQQSLLYVARTPVCPEITSSLDISKSLSHIWIWIASAPSRFVEVIILRYCGYLAPADGFSGICRYWR